MRVILHVGTPKTGTTALQCALTAGRKILRRRGVLYNTTFGDNIAQSWFCVRTMRGLPEPRVPIYWLRKLIRDTGELDGFVRRIDEAFDAEIGDPDIHTAIISAETIWECMVEPGVLEAMYVYLTRRFERIDVVVYLRQQDEFIASDYAQYFQQLHAHSLDEHIDDLLSTGRTDYVAQLSKLENVFGRERITVRVYERERLVGGSSVTDFLYAAGIVPDEPLPEQSSNESWDVETLGFLAKMIGVVELTDQEGIETELGTTILKAMRRMPKVGSSVGLSSDRAREIMSRHAEGNSQVARRYLGRDDGVLFEGQPAERDADVLPRIDVDGMARMTAQVLHGIGEDAAVQRDRHRGLVDRHRSLVERHRNLSADHEDLRARRRRLAESHAALTKRYDALRNSISGHPGHKNE